MIIATRVPDSSEWRMKIQSDLIGNYKKYRIKSLYDNTNKYGENRFTTAQSFADLNYNLASIACQTRQATADAARDIIDNQNANTRSIMDFMVQSKIDQLTSENTSLRGQISQAEQNAYLINALGAKAPQAAYVVANPYTGTAYAGYGCGATSACGCGV